MKRDGRSYQEVVDAAIRDLDENGYDSAERLAFWQRQIKEAAERMMGSASRMDELLRRTLAAIYKRMIDRRGVLKRHKGIGLFTLERVAPRLRAELDRRILASADLIRLNRQEAIEKTLRRFSGWATSIPRGGAAPGQAQRAREDVKRGLKSLGFIERRVLIDQGHKLTASISQTLAEDGGAIAVIWHSHWRQAGYDYRPDHKGRDRKVFLLRSSWARDRGLVKAGSAGYYDDVTAVAEEPYCRCWAEYVYRLSALPKDMLTKKGEAELEAARKKVKEMMR